MTDVPIFKAKNKRYQEKLLNAPLSPGCYIYYDKAGKPIYVGKAKNLRNRVKSYFNNFHAIEIQKQQMIELSESINYFEVDSEFEALILETNLIKKYHPKYNILMRDDKSYIYVRFEKVRKAGDPIPEAMSSFQDFPRISIVRKKVDDGAEYFGPFPSTTPAKRVLIKMRRIFPYRTSTHLVYEVSKDPWKVYTANSKPCFFYHIGLCLGACAGLEHKDDYVKRYNNIRKFFLGQKKEVINEMEKKLQKFVKVLNFEEAAKIRDQINDLKYIASNIHIDKDVDDVGVEKLKKDKRGQALNELISELQFPQEKLTNHESFRIECYDISNIQGTNAVGAMTVLIDGQLRPDLYRRFKIRMKNEPNDFGMLQEVLTRRFNQLLKSKQKEFIVEENNEFSRDLVKRAKNWKPDVSFSQIPDLIIIDGGKGQLASTYKILYAFGLHNEIPMVGLAKKEEEIFKLKNQFNDDYIEANESNHFDRILLPRRGEALFLVQRIRDEAHRFGITYHRNLRSKKMVVSK